MRRRSFSWLAPFRRKPPPNLDPQRQFLFVHIPKTAGTTISRALGLERTHHYYFCEYRKFVDEKTFSRLFKFAFVRHPLDRFISLYNYARMEVSLYHNNLAPEEGLYGAHADYSLLKDASLDECVDYLIEGRLSHNYPNTVWQPQSQWLCEEGQLVELDFLGRIENAEEDLAWLGQRLETDFGKDRVNRSDGGDSVSLLGRSSLQKLSEYYAADFENFGYRM